MNRFENFGAMGWETSQVPELPPLEAKALRDFELPHELVPLTDGREAIQTGAVEKAKEGHEVQGHNEFGFQGTCGLAAAAGVLRQFGQTVTENDIVRFALPRGLCSVSDNPFYSGGTTVSQQVAILEGYRLPAHWETVGSLEQVAHHVERGEGVICNLNAGVLWNDPSAYGNGRSNHAVAITGTLRDPHTGQLLGFYMNDTGHPGGAGQFGDARKMQAALVNAGGTLVATDTRVARA